MRQLELETVRGSSGGPAAASTGRLSKALAGSSKQPDGFSGGAGRLADSEPLALAQNNTGASSAGLLALPTHL